MPVFCHSGISTLSPPGVAPVCSGGQLELTCTTTGGFLVWTFNVFRGNESTVTNILRNILSTDSAGGAMSELIVNSTMFNFSRTSAQDRLPVMSRLLINPVSGQSTWNCDKLCGCGNVRSIVNYYHCQREGFITGYDSTKLSCN